MACINWIGNLMESPIKSRIKSLMESLRGSLAGNASMLNL